MITQELVRKLFNYNPKTGILTRRISGRCSNKGDIAGRTNFDGYLGISINKKNYLIHQIVWLYVYGLLTTKENKLQIDHINRIKNDNRLCNLRITNQTGNNQNRNLYIRNNISDVVGVSFRQYTWIAYITISKKNIYLGQYITKLEAVKARYKAELKYDWLNKNSTAKQYLLTYLKERKNL